ncbi:MAG: hypothetical protein QF890_05910 [Myxococcota bacterium]|jgi:hypothetical protein|nr:hypothetical protein [bacterium]MDP6244851.1 hypothetical protein [Myxococcota bacterium]MDP7297955.1 hypothetical protein [Myxococcota bacterium]MDP7432094.1 hypothetical protein [Myxococcota bacterium]HJO22056.1 hypothetical protein [Myxococcota bacterium]
MTMHTEGLHLEQAPPLAIPLSFFLSAPIAVVGAGLLLLIGGSGALTTSWAPLTLSLTHLGTLGLLAMVMMGALYQMTAVVAGSPVPRVRLAYAVHPLFVLGVVCLCWGTASVSAGLVAFAIGPLGVALLLFLIPVGTALHRAPTRNQTVLGMLLAVTCFGIAAVLGILMAFGHGGLGFPGPRPLWTQVHLSVALLGWVGGLLSAVSWQVLPMFYLAAPVPRIYKLAIPWLIGAGVALPLVVLLVDGFGSLGGAGGRSQQLAALGALPALVAVWGLHPLASLRSLASRRRRRSDGSLLFWRSGLLVAPAVALCAGAASLASDPRWGLLFGWLALWGWAGMVVHGMLTRIVPFLVWFHRFAPLVGRQRVPAARSLLPDRWVRRSYGLHVLTLFVGIGAIGLGGDGPARVLGASLLATGAGLFSLLVHVARQRPAA